jgi:hypothetical protein
MLSLLKAFAEMKPFRSYETVFSLPADIVCYFLCCQNYCYYCTFLNVVEVFCHRMLKVADSGHVIIWHVKCVACYHCVVCCQVAYGRGDLQTWKESVNVLNKQSHEAYKRWCSICGFEWGL